MKKLIWHDLVLQGLSKFKLVDEETLSQVGNIAMGYAVVSSKLFARNVIVPLHDYAQYKGWSKPFSRLASGRPVYNRPSFFGKYRGPPLGSLVVVQLMFPIMVTQSPRFVAWDDRRVYGPMGNVA